MLLPLLGWASWAALHTVSVGDAKQAQLAKGAINRVEALGKRADLQAAELRRELEAILGCGCRAIFRQPLLRQRRDLIDNAE